MWVYVSLSGTRLQTLRALFRAEPGGFAWCVKILVVKDGLVSAQGCFGKMVSWKTDANTSV